MRSTSVNGYGAMAPIAKSAYGSNIVQSLYDTTFQYCGGDKRRPSFGAGSAAQSSLQLFGGYRDAFAYEPRAGLGETVIAPLHGVLRARGVQFAFFHKLTRLELNGERDAVVQIHLDRQVDLLNETYKPTIPPQAKFGNLECWPAAPLWGQIKNGDALKATELIRKSSWCDYSVGPVTLRRGQEFDDVVLAIPVGAFKPRGKSSGPCIELIDASRQFKKMTDAASLSPSISVQAWCTQTLSQLGWPPSELTGRRQGLEDYPTCTGPSPLDVWADRAVVLAYENWGATDPGPASLQYMCDVLETSLFKEPPSRAGRTACGEGEGGPIGSLLVQREIAHALAVGLSPWDVRLECVVRSGRSARRGPSQVPGRESERRCMGELRRLARRVNAVAIEDGPVRLQQLVSGGGVDRHGFNVECIEAVVMSGKQAARAIAGTEAVIDGENRLHFERGLSGFIRELAMGAEALAEWTLAITLGSAGRVCGAELPAGVASGRADWRETASAHPRRNSGRRHERADGRIRADGTGSRTVALRDNGLSLGWRLGGKAAVGRKALKYNRGSSMDCTSGRDSMTTPLTS